MNPYRIGNQEFVSEYGAVRIESFIPSNEEDCDLPRMLHVHQDKLEIVFIREGNPMYTINGKLYQAKTDDILIMQPGVIHGREPAQGTMQSNYCCAIQGLQRPGLRENCLLPESVSPLLHCGEKAVQVRALLESMEREMAGAGRRSGQTVRHLLYALINMVLDIAEQQAPSREDEELAMVSRIKRYIDQHFMQNPSLSDIANHLHISMFYMAHFFKEKTGYTPLQYMVARQIGEAQTLLIHSDLSVQEIAEQVGDINPEHFNKVFKKHVGLPPGQFRKANRSGEKPADNTNQILRRHQDETEIMEHDAGGSDADSSAEWLRR